MAKATWKDRAEEQVARELGVRPVPQTVAKATAVPDWKLRHNAQVHGGRTCDCKPHNAPVPGLGDLD